MARSVLQDRNVLVLGIDSSLGRAAAQQLSRAGCRVVLASHDPSKLDLLIDQLVKKGGDPTALILSHEPRNWPDQIRMARERLGHLHIVVNAIAFTYATAEEQDACAEKSVQFDQVCNDVLVKHGPTKLITLWPNERPTPNPVSEAVWHCHVVLGPRQRLDAEHIPDLDASGTLHLRAGAVADSIVSIAQIPPSARPLRVELQAIPSAEKKENK